jgi:hypothetical protein
MANSDKKRIKAILQLGWETHLLSVAMSPTSVGRAVSVNFPEERESQQTQWMVPERRDATEKQRSEQVNKGYAALKIGVYSQVEWMLLMMID